MYPQRFSLSPCLCLPASKKFLHNVYVALDVSLLGIAHVYFQWVITYRHLNRKLRKIFGRHVAILYKHHFPTDAIEGPGQVGTDCKYDQTYCGFGLKSKCQHTRNWSAAVWPPRRVIAQQYSPAPSASVCFHSRKRKCGRLSKLRKSAIYSVKNSLTNFIFLGGLVPCVTSLS
jgi:hypothetical protein